MLTLLILTGQLYFTGIACQQFAVPQEICPGDNPRFLCSVEDVTGVAVTVWTVTTNGIEDDVCILIHSKPNDTRTCGPGDRFESYLGDPVDSIYPSTLNVSSISPDLNGTTVGCGGPAANTVINTSSICIVGGSSLPPQISKAVVSEADVSYNECVVTVRWSEPVISCNGSTSRYVLTVSPSTTECSSGDCEVERGDEGFEERERNFTLAVEHMLDLTIRADSCNNTQMGQESGPYPIMMKANPGPCQFRFDYDVRTLAIQTIQTTWKRVSLGSLGEANYSLIIGPSSQRLPVVSPDCNSTHCNYMYSSDSDYSVSVEAVGCVTRVTECQNISSRCIPIELVEDLDTFRFIEVGYSFVEGQVTYDGISEDSTATYTPSEGYFLNGTDTRTCQNGSWSGEVPRFEKVPVPQRDPKPLDSWQIALLVVGLIAFFVGVSIEGGLGSILVLRANCKTDGAIAVLLLIVSVLAFPVSLVVFLSVKKKELDEKGVYLKVFYRVLLVASAVITMTSVILWIVLLVYATTNGFVEDENDAEIRVRSSLVIACFVLSLVVTLEWSVRAALWKCGAVGTDTRAFNGPPPKPKRSKQKETDEEHELGLYNTLQHGKTPSSPTPLGDPHDCTYGHLQQEGEGGDEYNHIQRGEKPKAVPNPADPTYSHFKQEDEKPSSEYDVITE